MWGDEVLYDGSAIARSVEFVGWNKNTGPIYQITCPACFDYVKITPENNVDAKCKCGFIWTMSIQAFGDKDA